MSNEIITNLTKDPNHIYFTSDTHFGHENIIKFCNRPFKNAQEMDEALIKNWNSVIKPEDTIFHLGDFAFGGSKLWNNIMYQLNGHKILIMGNHDVRNFREGYIQNFEYIGDQLFISIDNRKVYLNHYPFLCYGGSYRTSKAATYQLFGHVHSGPISSGLDKERLINLFPYQYDVGVDNNNFTPISWNEICDKINKNVLHTLWKDPRKRTV